MPPKKSADQDGSPIGLTDGELRFIKAIFDNMTQKPDADWDAVANTVSLKDAKCAKERFRQMSVRHGWRSDGAGAGAGPSPRKSSTSTSSPRKSPAAVRKPRKTNATRSPSKKSAKKVKEDDEEIKEEAQSEEKKEIKAEAEDYDTN